MNIVARGVKTALRPFTDSLSDAEIARVYGWSRDPDVLKWSGGSPLELSLAEFHERIERERSSPPTDRLMFFIVTLEGDIIGRIGCFGLADGAQSGELGVVIGERAYWDRGFGRDAVSTMLGYLFRFKPLERVNLYTYPDNIRAQRSFAACGFRTLGTAQRFSSDLGEFTGLEMQITRAEYLTKVPPVRNKIPVPQGHT